MCVCAPPLYPVTPTIPFLSPQMGKQSPGYIAWEQFYQVVWKLSGDITAT